MAAAEIFEIKQYDTAPPVEAQLLDAQDKPVPINIGDTVRFKLASQVIGLRALLDKPATIVDADLGKVIYQWEAGDTDVVALCRGEFVLVRSGGIRRETYPNGGEDPYITIDIIPSLS